MCRVDCQKNVLPIAQSRTCEQQQCWRRSLEYLGRSGMLKKLKNAKKVKKGPTDQPIDQPTHRRTDGLTQRGVELRLKRTSEKLCQRLSSPQDF